jgi:hypothetical protein
MAYECNGKWINSTLTPKSGGQKIDDGIFIVDPENPTTGMFTGLHANSGGLIAGTCKSLGKGIGIIDFIRREKEGEFYYQYHCQGEFKLNQAETIYLLTGHYTKTQLPTPPGVFRIEEDNKRITEPDGDWTGEKPIT